MAVKDAEPTAAEIKRNHGLWKHYPLGYVNSIYDILESMRQYLSLREIARLDKIYEALDELDKTIRHDRYPVKKSK